MDSFFQYLRKGLFKVKYDTEYNEEWNNKDTQSVSVTHSVNRKATQSVSVDRFATRSVNFFEICDHIVELDCSYTDLTILPDLPNVITLKCNHNLLTKLPSLPRITSLSCYNNKLNTLTCSSEVKYYLR